MCNTYYFLRRQEAVEREGLAGFLAGLNLCRGASLCRNPWTVPGVSSPCFTPFLPRPGSVPPEDMNSQTVIPWYCSSVHYQLHTNPEQLCARPLRVGEGLPHDCSVESRWREKGCFSFLLLKKIFCIQDLDPNLKFQLQFMILWWLKANHTFTHMWMSLL